jgi:hypothetical protein
MVEESNVHAVQSPVTVCGDIHGQFWDVLEIFRQGGEAPENSYIFMVRPVCSLSGTRWRRAVMVYAIGGPARTGRGVQG